MSTPPIKTCIVIVLMATRTSLYVYDDPPTRWKCSKGHEWVQHHSTYIHTHPGLRQYRLETKDGAETYSACLRCIMEHARENYGEVTEVVE
jgi:hypothetical protein